MSGMGHQIYKKRFVVCPPLSCVTIYFFGCSESEEEEEEEPREKRSKAGEGEDGFWGSSRPYEEQQEEKRKERERKRHQDGQDDDGWECVANTHSRKTFFYLMGGLSC
jgi:hypothetical protein